MIQHDDLRSAAVWASGRTDRRRVSVAQDGVHDASASIFLAVHGNPNSASDRSLERGFGSNAYFLFKRGVGRFRNSLPQALSALGDRTMLASSCRRSFLNYDAFYRSIGVDERIFTDDLPPPFDLGRFETTNSDALFLEAALGAHMKGIAGDPAPRFLYVLTNFNHGPHNRRLVAPGQFERERGFAAASLGDAQYAEYYARLAETATTWNGLKAELSARFPHRPTLVLHYGDHQPVMTRRIEAKLKLPADARRQFRTFYAIETLNAASDPSVAEAGADLDIAFLGTVVLQRAGLPLDAIFATRASRSSNAVTPISPLGRTPLPLHPGRTGHDRPGADAAASKLKDGNAPG